MIIIKKLIMPNNRSSTSTKYSKITLLPIDKDELRKFQDFRSEDVFYMLRFMSILATCEVVLLVLVFLHALAVD